MKNTIYKNNSKVSTLNLKSACCSPSPDRASILSKKHPAVYLDLEGERHYVYADNRNKSGIYMLTNKITKKFYVGQSSNLTARFYEYYAHKRILPAYLNSFILKSILKFGLNNFSLTILEYCPKELLLARELFYINALNPAYNIRKHPSKRVKYPIPLNVLGEPLVTKS